jgi:hypothetical protein
MGVLDAFGASQSQEAWSTFNLDLYLFFMQMRALNEHSISFNAWRETAQYSLWVRNLSCSVVTREWVVCSIQSHDSSISCSISLTSMSTEPGFQSGGFSWFGHSSVEFVGISPACLGSVCWVSQICLLPRQGDTFLFITQKVYKDCFFYIHCGWQQLLSQFEKYFQHSPFQCENRTSDPISPHSFANRRVQCSLQSKLRSEYLRVLHSALFPPVSLGVSIIDKWV